MEMTVEKMFEVAARNKVRFSFRGMISVEDLWDLSVENLDVIFKTLNAQSKQMKEESLLGSRSKEDEELSLKIEIVKFVVKTKLEEFAKRMKDKEQKEKRQKIMEIMSTKKDADLQNKSLDELSKMLDELS